MNPDAVSLTDAPSGPPLLCARDLARAFGDHVVPEGISLDVAPGQRLGLVGENGSGKPIRGLRRDC